MDDLISRQAAIDAYGDWYVEEGPAEGFIGTVKQLLEGLPSAEPEIIRCRECKYAEVADKEVNRMRLIDADALEKYLSDAEIEATRQRKYVFASALNTICGNVRNFPTIKPERKKGKWIDKSGGIGDVWNYCSVCGEQAIDLYDFCPNCGADMRGERE